MINNRRIHRLIFTLTTLLVCVATYAQQDTVRILSIGNSSAREAFGYVPALVEEASPNTYVEFGILYVAGGSLRTNWTYIKTSAKGKYEFDYYSTASGHWTTAKQVSLTDGLSKTNWDIVILQQESLAAGDYATYQPWLDNLENWLRIKLPKAAFAWHLTPAYSDGYKALGKLTSEQMWNRTCIAAQQVMQHNYMSLIIPTGTAIEYARHTELDQFGKFGHLTYDGMHMQEGVPCLIESYTAAQCLLNYFGIEANIESSKSKVSDDWIREKRIPQPYGQVQDIKATDYLLCKVAALRAVDMPYKIPFTNK